MKVDICCSCNQGKVLRYVLIITLPGISKLLIPPLGSIFRKVCFLLAEWEGKKTLCLTSEFPKYFQRYICESIVQGIFVHIFAYIFLLLHYLIYPLKVTSTIFITRIELRYIFYHICFANVLLLQTFMCMTNKSKPHCIFLIVILYINPFSEI